MVTELQAPNIIDGVESMDASGGTADRLSPVSNAIVGERTESGAHEIARAIEIARAGHAEWASTTPVHRGDLIRAITRSLEDNIDLLADLVQRETGKGAALAAGEVRGAIELGYFMASEGRRFYGRTTTSAVPGKQVSTWRAPIGVGALLAASNTPIPNYAWKVFPALLCGNSVILKPSEHTPFSGAAFARICLDAGVPASALQLLQGSGPGTGAQLTESAVDLVSFTGSAVVGRGILASTGPRLVRTALELGGKNAMIVCDDADLPRAVDAAVASAFSNAGQRCAAASRLIIMDAVYDRFVDLLLDKVRELSLFGQPDSVGPVISQASVTRIVTAIDAAATRGAQVLIGGRRSPDPALSSGNFIEPTVIAGVDADDPVSCDELFGPVINAYRVPDFAAATTMAAHGQYGLTGAIWTDSVDRAQYFTTTARVGMAVVNGPTFGSEPHMPFGGFASSGNGTKECGTEVLDFYTELRTVAVLSRPPA